MAYETQEWADGQAGGTPITADRLNHMEAGIADGQNVTPTWASVTGKPTEFPPESHTHTDIEARLTALESAVEALENPEA